jgi:ABC-type phosphate/phosphonate transport system substrate-binding protein
LPEALRAEIRALLLSMHTAPPGRGMLERARFDRFVAASDRDYNPIRAMARKAAKVPLA